MKWIIENFKIVAFITLCTYPIIKHRSLKRAIIRIASIEEKFLLGIFFGILSILGSLTGVIIFNGINIQSNLIGPLVGGIIGGPFVGIISGSIGGLYRYGICNMTSIPDMVSTILAGLIGGFYYIRNKKKKLNLLKIYFYGVVCELISLLLIIFFIEPRILARVYFTMLGVNMLIINPIGVMMLVSLIKDVQYNQNLVGANYAEKSLEIAKQTIEILKDGFHEKSANKIAKTIYRYTGVLAVEIIDSDGTRTYVGENLNIDSSVSKKCYSNDLNKATSNNDLISSQKPDGRYEIFYNEDYSIIRSPLLINEEIIGYIGFYKWTHHFVPTDIKMIEGISSLLSIQIQNTYVTEQEKLLIQSEYNALKAQVNPHFLYNTLNVIKTMIRLDATKAQQLIIHLADFYRRSLSEQGDMITFIEELKTIRVYLDLQKARFGNNINLDIDIDEYIYDLLIPTFIVQPLVENSILHGFPEDSENHTLHITIVGKINHNKIRIEVIDNGKGFDPNIIENINQSTKSKKARIGLINISRRLKSIFKNNHTFRLSNNKKGAKVTIILPILEKKKEGTTDEYKSFNR